MKKCVIPGSYDPVTVGHAELFKTASALFDVVYVVIVVNSAKQGGMFTADERLRIMNSAIDSLKRDGYNNIKAVLYSGLTTDCAEELGAKYLVKGIRNATDFAYEYDLSQISRRFDPTVETLFLPSKAEVACVSSTYVRELIKYGKFDSSDFAPGTAELIKNLKENK